MSYKRAEEVLPSEVVELIQQYVDGENIYIPRKTQNRIEWGAGTQTKKDLCIRNQKIYLEYISGKKVVDLANEYCLSEKSIQRIIRENRK